MSVKAGIKKFRQKFNDALLNHIKLHSHDALVPVKKDELTSADKNRALRFLMFINEKRMEL